MRLGAYKSEAIKNDLEVIYEFPNHLHDEIVYRVGILNNNNNLPDVIITADCGSSDEKNISRLKSKGIDVIVTDHHAIPMEGVPNSAYCTVNPTQKNCKYPSKVIAGCMVSWLVMCALRNYLISKNYLDIKKVICVTGPGNYTNIRTGLAVAKSISLVNNIDTYGITQHELIAETYQYSPISNAFIVITHSTNNNFYYKEFNQNMPDQLDPILLHADEVLNKIDKIKSNIIETGNEFLNYLIRNNLSVKNLTSNYKIPDNNLGKICESKSIISNNIEAKYIKTPNFVKYKRRDIYE